jgi:hypothetical protein
MKNNVTFIKRISKINRKIHIILQFMQQLTNNNVNLLKNFNPKYPTITY